MIRTFRLKLILQLTILTLLNLNTVASYAEDELADLEYVPIEPVIVTNYLKKSKKKPGFIQIRAQLTVRGKVSAELAEKHMPLVRDFIIEFLSFTDEAVIKDVSKRNQLRASLSTGIQEMLTDKVGEPLIEELVITHFMWD